MEKADQKNKSSSKTVLVRHQNTRSLKVTIGLLYTVLAVINIVFFSVMMFENQSDLLVNTFKYQSSSLVNEVLNNLEGLRIGPQKDNDYKALESKLNQYQIKYFLIFDKDAKILHQFDGKDTKAPAIVDKKIMQKIGELAAEESVFQSRYSMELNERDYSIDLLMPVKAKESGKLFLFTPLNIRSMQKRLNDMWFQIGLSIGWGVVFHILFAIYLFRVIFRRISILKDTSDQMSSGDLSVRALWKQSKSDDELDELGVAFNSMAENIEDKVNTISNLNQEIQKELKIGKEVQELFLGNLAIYKDYKIDLFYKPLREVSGDVYKFYELPNGFRALFFADASGHGVSAALITTITLMSLDEILRDTMKPGEVLSQLNDMLAVRLDTSYFATGVFFLMEPDGKISFTNAGHNPVLCVRPSNKEIWQLDKMGPPMGLMEEFSYPTSELEVKSKDKVLIYSDGLVETPDKSGEQYELDRVNKMLLDNIDEENPIISQKLSTEFTDFAFHYKDDVTFILLEIP